jgi:hypothetical protein
LSILIFEKKVAMTGVKYIKVKAIGNDKKGFLSYFESSNEIPFEIKRIYYIYGVPVGKIRGKHAHKFLKQAIWCPIGKIELILDNGKVKNKYVLNSPEKILLISGCIWREFVWGDINSVLCVAASDFYNENDYIRKYTDFLKFIKEDL